MGFGKAFDSADHVILLQNMYHIGVRSTHKLVSNYLAYRFKYVRVDDKNSAMKSTKRGIPQDQF